MPINAEIASHSAYVRDGEAIFHEGRDLGFVVMRADGYEAVTASGTMMGRFNTVYAAARALFASAAPFSMDGCR